MRKNVIICAAVGLIMLAATTVFAGQVSPKKTHVHYQPPKLTVVVVIDQCAWHYFNRLKPFFTGGLKELLDRGVVYTQAYHAHGIPETTPGHHAIATGTLPKDHGAITNQWLDNDCHKIAYDNDASLYSSILDNGTNVCQGKSAHNTMVDGLSDQFMLRSLGTTQNNVFALSLKSYPAIAMAGRMGKALWFNEKTGKFTSSRRYFKKLPDWVIDFNKKESIAKIPLFDWDLAYPSNAPAYDFPYIDDKAHAAYKFSLIGKGAVRVDLSKKEPYEFFMRCPSASESLLRFAQTCLKEYFDAKGQERMLLWVSLSNLDLLGHMYGPDSREVVDMLYHIDHQLKGFIEALDQIAGSGKYLLALTADHGVAPIPEIQQKKGFHQALRISQDKLIAGMNMHIQKRFQVSGVVASFEPSFFWLNQSIMKKLSHKLQRKIKKALVYYLRGYRGIKNAWTRKELKRLTFKESDLEQFYKNQLYHGRCGDIVCQPQPYCLVTHYLTGTSHATPYDYDTHVPLMLYQPGLLAHRYVHTKVWVPQLPVTLAKLVRVSRPSVSTYDVLPGLGF
ncbi:MAG: alkaline phosphatase family protein [Candidatus Babeliales bacterium]